MAYWSIPVAALGVLLLGYVRRNDHLKHVGLEVLHTAQTEGDVRRGTVTVVPRSLVLLRFEAAG